MPTQAHILIVEAHGELPLAMAEALRDEGYHVERCADPAAAEDLLATGDWNVLIAQVADGADAAAALVRDLASKAPNTQAIVLVDRSSPDTAIELVQLKAAAYLPLPPDEAELLAQVRSACRISNVCRTVGDTNRQLKQWGAELEDLGKAAWQMSMRSPSMPISAYMALTRWYLFTISSQASDLTHGLLGDEADMQVCGFFACPKLASLVGGVEDAIEVLEKTRRAFKSKDLAELRRRLEGLREGLDSENHTS